QLGLEEVEEQIGAGGLSGDLDARARREVDGSAALDAHVAAADGSAAVWTGGDLDARVQGPPVGALAAALQEVQALLALEEPIDRADFEEPQRLQGPRGVLGAAEERDLDAAALGPARVHALQELDRLGGVAAGADALDAEEDVATVLGRLGSEAVL